MARLDIAVADNSPDASPRGMAIRFEVGRGTDIMAISHNGFVVGTGEDFLALEKAIAATDQSKPHPLAHRGLSRISASGTQIRSGP